MNNKVTWTDITNFVDTIEMKYSKKQLTGVYGIPRGGLILAVLISHKLNIPLLAAPTKGCIIVDDIADTGRSLQHYTINETQKNKYYIITYAYKPHSTVVPDTYALMCDNNIWVEFPWE